jgi:hypothetical protein
VAIEIGAQNAAVEKEIGEFSLADNFDQARGLGFLRWWDSVAKLTLCFLCSALHAVGPAHAPISLSISKRRDSAKARGRCARTAAR